MKVTKTNLEGCLIIEPDIYADKRGLFLETFQKERYQSEAGINFNFVQDNFSSSKKGVLRGLHFQKSKPQGKLVSVSRGKVFDVAVDLRSDSKTFGQWHGMELSGENKLQLWIPPCFAHGFLVISDEVDFQYKCTDYYNPLDEAALLWNDPDLAIIWPEVEEVKLSKKDSNALSLKELLR